MLLNFDGYPPMYKNAAEKLISNLSNINNLIHQKQIFEDFYAHYSVVPCLWKKWLSIEFISIAHLNIANHENWKNCVNLWKKSINHFYVDAKEFEKVSYNERKSYCKMLTFPDFERVQNNTKQPGITRLQLVLFLKQALTFPHSKLDEILTMYKYCSDSPLNKTLLKKHENAKKLYEKIMATNIDAEWLNCLLQVEDDEFIVQNIEWRLSNDPCNQNIWKFYFDFSEKHQNDIRVLEIYRRYCRLFIEDTEKREIYTQKIESFKNSGNDVSKWEIDLFNFKQYFLLNQESILTKLSPVNHDSMENKLWVCDDLKLAYNIMNKKCTIHFNPKNSSYQQFSIPKTILFYLPQKFTIQVYRKLIQTCKYFFIQKQIIPVWHVGVTWNQNFFIHESAFYFDTETNIFLSNKVWLENSVTFFGNSKILDKIYQSDIQYLYASSISITMMEYEILTKNKKIKEITMYNVEVKTTEEDLEEIKLENLIENLPNANKIRISLQTMLVTSASSHALSKLKRNIKLEIFFITKITEVFEPKGFCEFLKNNICQKSDFCICYTGQIGGNYQNIMNAAVQEIVVPLQEHEENQLPKVLIHFPQ